MPHDENTYSRAKSFWSHGDFARKRAQSRNVPENYFGGDILGDSDLHVNARSLHLVKIMKGYFSRHDKIKVHELGCNIGRNLYFIRHFFQQSIVTGNDISEEAIKIGKKLYDFRPPHEKLFVEDSLNFSTELFNRPKADCIISMAHFMHIPSDVMEEIAMLLKDSTKLLICYESALSETYNDKDGFAFYHNYKALFGEPIFVQEQPFSSLQGLFVWRFE